MAALHRPRTAKVHRALPSTVSADACIEAQHGKPFDSLDEPGRLSFGIRRPDRSGSSYRFRHHRAQHRAVREGHPGDATEPASSCLSSQSEPSTGNSMHGEVDAEDGILIGRSGMNAPEARVSCRDKVWPARRSAPAELNTALEQLLPRPRNRALTALTGGYRPAGRTADQPATRLPSLNPVSHPPAAHRVRHCRRQPLARG